MLTQTRNLLVCTHQNITSTPGHYTQHLCAHYCLCPGSLNCKAIQTSPYCLLLWYSCIFSKHPGSTNASLPEEPRSFKKLSSIERTIVFYRDEKQIPLTQVTLPQQAFATASSVQIQQSLAAVNPASPH